MTIMSIEDIREGSGASNGKTRVAGYVRTASDVHTKNWALLEQENAIRDFCDAKDWYLNEIFVDKGRPAWGEEGELRPEYLRMMADVENERFDIVVTYSIDRMSRSILNIFRTLKTFEEHGVKFVAIRGDLGFSGTTERVLMALFSALAEMQYEAIPICEEKGGS